MQYPGQPLVAPRVPQKLETPLFIFDLDGTLSDPSHRRHLVEKPANPGPNEWAQFFALSAGDPLIMPVATTFMAIYERGCEVRIWSGRDDATRAMTESWLVHNLDLSYSTVRIMLEKMRPHNDTTPDHELKRKWLKAMHPGDRSRLVAVFDDRQKVVDMWRAEGVQCFQAAPGNF